MAHHVPEDRIDRANDKDLREDGDFILYWMTSFRRVHYNFAFQRAVELAADLDKPVVVFEALRNGYRWASDRHHKFVIDGMAENWRALEDQRVLYAPYIERKKDEGKGLLAALSEHACAIVTDDFPAFMLPHMIAAAADQVDVLLEKVDGNGILPMRLADREFTRAHSFRRHLHKVLPPHLDDFPKRDPLSGYSFNVLDELPGEVTSKWQFATLEELEEPDELLATLPIDHDVVPVDYRGGASAARDVLDHFLTENLPHYDDDRNHPDNDVASGLSPYLHFGHISAHEVFAALAERDDWSPDDLAEKPTGSREGWWNMSSEVEAFLDELITWREIGFNVCVQRPDDYDEYESLPDWAKKTLAEHEDDPREHVYSLEEFENAETHEPLWNAAQNQLVVEGRIHNYLRMLWGKKILHWTASPRDALEIMTELNNKYAVDGRDPNSYSGIFWVLGRHDRAWGPEREIFGKIRYMTCKSARSKLRLRDYEERWSGDQQSLLDLS